MRLFATSCVAVFLVAVAGCGDDDGNPPVDSGMAPADAGGPVDGGGPRDSGAPMDAGGSPTDASTPAGDAGTLTAAAVCTAATPVTLTAPSGSMTASMTVMGALTGASTDITGSCWTGSTTGAQAWTVTVPAGMHDLIANTDVAPTGMIDTVAHIRRTCTDEMTEVACNDSFGGASMERPQAARAEYLDAAAGTYSVIIVGYMLTSSQPIGVSLGLRPVLAAGAACDPMGINNRCATSACPTSGAATCP